MRARILQYLRESGRPLPAQQILEEAVQIHSPNTLTADRVLRKILHGDPRFRCEHGLWSAVPLPAECAQDLANRAVSLCIERSGRHARRDVFRGAVCSATKCALFMADAFARKIEGTGLAEAHALLHDRLLVVWGSSALRLWNRLQRALRLAEWHGDTVDLRPVAARISDAIQPRSSLECLAAATGLPAPDPGEIGAMARHLHDSFLALIPQVPPEHRGDPRALTKWAEEGRPKVDFSRLTFGPDFLRALPDTPGVYVMKNRAADIIYVGKSRNLRRRVRSYFRSRALADPKVHAIHEHLHSLEIVPAASEIEALLLEVRFIKDFRPLINLQTEVRENADRYGPAENLIILAAEGDGVCAYFLRAGRFAGKAAAELGKKPSRKVAAMIKSLYFSPKRHPSSPPDALEQEIVSRWLAANRKRLNAVNVDAAGTPADVIRQLTAYLQDPEKLTTRVFYR